MNNDLVLTSINNFPLQIRQSIEDINNINFPASYKQANNIIISGMGGSLFSYYVINNFFRSSLKVPFYAVNDYQNPAFLNKNTLFIASSYSGTTEEVIATTEDALKCTNLVSGITIGGKLNQVLSENNKTFYHIDPQYNPSKQPRLGSGYMIFGTTLMLAKFGYIDLNIDELSKAINTTIKNQMQIYKLAEDIIEKVTDKVIIYSSAEHLSGPLHVVRNQTNESAKHLAHYNIIPELNHHFMEGLQFPQNKNIIFLFYNSSFFNPKIAKRFKLTAEIVGKNNVPYQIIDIKSDNKLEELLNFLQFGSYLTYLLGVKHGVDPMVVPWVDYFKAQLSRTS